MNVKNAYVFLSEFFSEAFKFRFNDDHEPSELFLRYFSKTFERPFDSGIISEPGFAAIENLKTLNVIYLFAMAKFSSQVNTLLNNPEKSNHSDFWQFLWERDFPLLPPPPPGTPFKAHYESNLQKMLRDFSALPSIISFAKNTENTDSEMGFCPDLDLILEKAISTIGNLDLKSLSSFWVDYRTTVNKEYDDRRPWGIRRESLFFFAVRTVPFEATDILQILIDLVENLEMVNDQNETLLYVAAELRADYISHILLQAGAQPTPDPLKYKSPLSIALRYSRNELAKVMIENGANVNAKNMEGNTPLHDVKNASIMKLLLKHGADPRALDAEGLTPLDRVNKRISEGKDIDPHPYLLQVGPYRQRHSLLCPWRRSFPDPEDTNFLEQMHLMKQVLTNVLNPPRSFSRLFSCLPGVSARELEPPPQGQNARYKKVDA